MGIWDKFYERAKSFFAESDRAEPKSHCYYDLLEVSRDANEDEIKRSFKRLALKWHPDKNPERAEECTAYFVLIQQAYEVLIDPQERAFYDRHRENIIHRKSGGPDDGGLDERRDTGISLEPFMSTSCFRGGLFANDEERADKFYGVYRDLFHQLAAEEYDYIEDPEERNFPVFGKSTSDYDTVVAPFYAFWLDFCTRRSFAWLDKWDLREAPDRPSARAMEKENRKLREQGKKKRSEEVRRLVEFVRKHDARVEEAKKRQKERNAQMQQIVEEQRRITIRRNLENLEAFELDERAQQQHLENLEEIEQALDAEFGISNVEEESGSAQNTDDDDDSTNQIRCIVCEKTFKSRQVLANHQRSKKHRQMLEQLRIHMQEEDQQFFEELDEEEGGEGSGQEEERKRRGKRQKKRGKKAKEVIEEEEGEKEAEKEEVEAKESGEKENETCKVEKTKRNKQKGGEKTEAMDKKQKDPRPKGPVSCECLTCGDEFDSKTKLHAHLRDSGHAALKTTTSPPNLVGAGKKKGRKGGKQ